MPFENKVVGNNFRKGGLKNKVKKLGTA